VYFSRKSRNDGQGVGLIEWRERKALRPAGGKRWEFNKKHLNHPTFGRVGGVLGLGKRIISRSSLGNGGSNPGKNSAKSLFRGNTLKRNDESGKRPKTADL